MELPVGYNYNNRYSDKSHDEGPSLDIGDLAMDTQVPDDSIDLIKRLQLIQQIAVVKD